MEITTDVLNDFKQYARIDGDAENAQLTSFLLAAISFLQNAADITPDLANDLHKIGVYLLAVNFYENRLPLTETNVNNLDYSLQSIIYQMRYASVTNGGV